MSHVFLGKTCQQGDIWAQNSREKRREITIMWASVCPAEGTASSKALGRICRGLVIQSKLISEHVMGLDNNFFRSLLVSWPQPYISLPLAIPEGIPLSTYNSQTHIQPTPVIIPPQMSMLKSDKTYFTPDFFTFKFIWGLQDSSSNVGSDSACPSGSEKLCFWLGPRWCWCCTSWSVDHSLGRMAVVLC